MEYSVILVDDHDLVRGGIKSLIEDNGNSPFSVIAEFGNGSELLAAIKTTNIWADVIVLDLDMPIMNGQETLVHLQALYPRYKVLVLTISGDDTVVLSMVRMGARGFLPKYCNRHELRQAIGDIIQTGYYHSELEIKAMHLSITDKSKSHKIQDVYLTEREIEFLQLVCDKRELSYKLIASEMNVSIRTVDGYREALFLKLDIKTKVGLVFYAMRKGIIRI